MAEAGRPTDLTQELLKEIKQCIIDGKNLKETAKLCEINEGTFYVWHSDNHLGLADKIEGWKRDRKLMLADKNIETILTLDANDKDFTKPVADMTKFVKETLDKKNYSKRSEITGKDGEAVVSGFNFISNGSNDTTNNQTGGSVEEATGQDN